jgi:hypothetical protein
MAEDSVYVSLSIDEQRKYRSELLLAQTEVLNLVKRIAVVNDIKKEKDEYRLKLAREFSVLLDKLKKFSGRLPDPKIPKTLIKKENRIVAAPPCESNSPMHQITSVEEDAIEKELRDIQRQLKLLNG